MIIQSFKMALKSISSNKMRSFLTMLGIIIGVMALVVLVSLVSGTTDSVQNSISSIGTDLLTVTISGTTDSVQNSISSIGTDLLTYMGFLRHH